MTNRNRNRNFNRNLVLQFAAVEFISRAFKKHGELFPNLDDFLKTVAKGINGRLIAEVWIVGWKGKKAALRVVLGIDWEKHTLSFDRVPVADISDKSSVLDQITQAADPLARLVSSKTRKLKVDRFEVYYVRNTKADSKKWTEFTGGGKLSKSESEEISSFDEGYGLNPQDLSELTIYLATKSGK